MLLFLQLLNVQVVWETSPSRVVVILHIVLALRAVDYSPPPTPRASSPLSLVSAWLLHHTGQHLQGPVQGGVLHLLPHRFPPFYTWQYP